MIIETYLDLSHLSSSQTVVVVDENGKKWDVLEALNSPDTSPDSGNPPRLKQRNTELVLERWRVELRNLPIDGPDDFGPTLPTIYKRSIVFFRSLYVATRFMPCWGYAKQAMTRSIHPALEVKCRFFTQEPEYPGCDPLRQPLHAGRETFSDYVLGDLELPVGRFYTTVTYRKDCDFRVEDSESILSSRLMGVDEDFFKPSFSQSGGHRRDSYTEIGPVPPRKHGGDPQEPQQQTYGSLSTFHGDGALGTSPMTALRAVRPAGSDTSSPPGSAPTGTAPELDPPHSLPIRSQSSAARPPLRTAEGTSRRPSVSFQPFKAGSLSGSPRIHDMEAPPSPQSIPRGAAGSITQGRSNRSSLTAGMAASLRGGPPPGDAPVVGSPKPGNRYSSSFTHRRARPSYGGQSKAGDDEQGGSSGKQSLSSSAQPGSGLLAEAGGAASSGSFHTDDDNISEFLKALDSTKTLQSFEPDKKGESSAAKKTVAQLSKFHLMRDSHNALTESMTSSMHLQRSSSSSSRQLANVPSMVNPASMSASSSPSKPLSPHTPYTPAIPSRLSENSIVNYQGYGQGGHGPTSNPEMATAEAETPEEDAPVSQEGTNAIDIPLSPRLLHTVSSNRRASSVAHQHRASEEDDADADLVQRSISLGGDDREAPTLSTLLAMQGAAAADDSSSPPGLQPAANIRSSDPPSPSVDHREPKSSPTSLRLRYAGRGRPTPPASARGSFSGGRFGAGVARSAGEEGADDEPLVFAMSELERDSRRSLEEARGAGAAAGSGSAGPSGRPPFEPKGTSKRGW